MTDERIPAVVYEDEHLLVVNKPAGWNTHAPSPFAGEGIYDWLRQRDPSWSGLAILHRLDKETSGMLVFGKTPLANQALTRQFSQRRLSKRYLLLTDRPPPRRQFAMISSLVRAGEKYVSRPVEAGGERAETHFHVLRAAGARTLIEARPVTGRTHQIRVQAAAAGVPILGDSLYGGSAAPRVCLHAEAIAFEHPATGQMVTFQAPADFESDHRLALRQALIDPALTNACRWLHGAADGWPGWYVDRLGDYLLSQSERPLTPAQRDHLRGWMSQWPLAVAPASVACGPPRGAYHKLLSRRVARASAAEASPEPCFGETAPDPFLVRENGLEYFLSMHAGYSVGLFLDQRDNRRRFLANHIAADFPVFAAPPNTVEVLNTFAYTCGFSVCAARAGARTTSIDLSKKYLDWGKQNFARNGLDPAAHDFIYGDVFDWARRLHKKGRRFAVVILDPPTFSRSKERGVFQAERDYGRLIAAVLPLLGARGVLLASSNAAEWKPEAFLAGVEAAVTAGGRRVMQRRYFPQPPDFPVARSEPAYLKTVWLRLA